MNKNRINPILLALSIAYNIIIRPIRLLLT